MSKLLCSLLLIVATKLYANDQAINFSIATAQIPPYVYVDENNQIKGLLIDILDQAQRTSLLRIQVYVMPWGRAINEVKSNRIDAIMPALWSEERSNYLIYPKRSFYSFDDSVLIKRVEDPFEFKGLASIGKDKTIGKTRLVMVDPEFDQMVKQGELSIYETTKLDEALLMLAQQKINFVASDRGIALTTIRNLGLENKFTLYGLQTDTPASFIAFSNAFADKQDINHIMDTVLKQVN